MRDVIHAASRRINSLNQLAEIIYRIGFCEGLLIVSAMLILSPNRSIIDGDCVTDNVIEKKSFTQKFVDDLKPKPKIQTEYSDAGRGLWLRVSYGGTKTYFAGFRTNGRQRRMTIGKHPHWTLKEARAEAHRILGQVAHGKDPLAEKIKAKSSNKVLDFQEAVALYIETHAQPKNRSWRETDRTLKRYFVSRWARVSLGSIDKPMIREAVLQIRADGKHSAANQAFAAIRAFFRWCRKEDYLANCPCDGLSMPARLQARERVLKHDEIAKILRAADVIGEPFGVIVKLLFLTGQRRMEVAGMNANELDMEQAVWTIPGSRTKNKRQHQVPLVPSACAAIGNLPNFGTDLKFSARGKPERVVSGFAKWKLSLDQASGVSNWRLHDIRRTVATNLGSLGVDDHVIRSHLNHAEGGATPTYNRYDYVRERRDALLKWEKQLEVICASNPNIKGG